MGYDPWTAEATNVKHGMGGSRRVGDAVPHRDPHARFRPMSTYKSGEEGLRPYIDETRRGEQDTMIQKAEPGAPVFHALRDLYGGRDGVRLRLPDD